MQTYSYDSLNRLKDATESLTPTGGSAAQTWKQTFLYDRYGNRTFDTDQNRTTTIPTNCPAAVCNPTANTSDNRLRSSDGYLFDSAGNTTKDAQLRKFTYDAENKQTKVETTNSGGTVIATNGEYWYDGDGKRVRKKGYTNNVPTEETVFVYDAMGKLVAEYSVDIAPVQTATVAYLTNDHLGSPRVNTDKNGNVIARHDYRPFGEEIATSQRNAGLGYADDTVRKQFTGYEKDIESELDFGQARYYSPTIGRFFSVDPENALGNEEYPQSWNAYAYVINNPLAFRDSDGRKWRVCDADQNCVTISDDEANRTLFNRKSNHPEIIRKDGKIFDEDGNNTGTYERLSFDDLSDSANALIFGSNSIPVQVEKKSRAVRVAATVAGVAGVCIGTAGAACEDAILIGTTIIDNELHPDDVQQNAHPPGFGKGWVKLRGNQGYKDPEGNIWKKDNLHKDHWDVSDRRNNKIREVDFNGRKIWPGGPKNKGKR